MREVKGILYRVRGVFHSWLVEVSEEHAQEEIAEFCARKSMVGDSITSVSRVFATSTDSPRVRVLSTPEFKAAIKRLGKEANERSDTNH